MGNRLVHHIECLQTLGTSESGRQKVTALNLFYPTASPPFAKNRFFGIATQPLKAGLARIFLVTTLTPLLPAQFLDLARQLGKLRAKGCKLLPSLFPSLAIKATLREAPFNRVMSLRGR